MGIPQNGWFTGEHPVEIDNLGIPPLWETSIFLEQIIANPGLRFFVLKIRERNLSCGTCSMEKLALAAAAFKGGRK